MNRNLSSIDIGDHNSKRKRFLLVIEDDPSGPALDEIQRRQHGFLLEIVDNPTLLNCGPGFAERLTVFHNGKAWVLTAEAEAAVP